MYPDLKNQAKVVIEFHDDEETVTRLFDVSGFSKYVGFPRVGYFIQGTKDNVQAFGKAKGATINVTTCRFEVTCRPGDLIGDTWHLYVSPALANDLPDMTTLEKNERIVELLVSYKKVPRTNLELPTQNRKSMDKTDNPYKYDNLVLEEQPPNEKASVGGAEEKKESVPGKAALTACAKTQLPALIAKLERRYVEATEQAEKVQKKMEMVDLAMKEIQKMKEMVTEMASMWDEFEKFKKRFEETKSATTDSIKKLEQTVMSIGGLPVELQESNKFLEDLKAITIAILDVVD